MPSTAPRIVFALVGDVCTSSRALRQLRWLSEEGYAVDALTFGTGDGGPEGVRLHPVVRPAGRGPRFFWAAHRAFRRAALALPADVYHASDLYTLPALAAASRQSGGRLVFDSRELYPHVDATARKPWSSWTWSAVERTFVPRCDAVFTVSPAISERIAHAYRIAEPTVVYNLPTRRTLTEGDALRERLPIPLSQPIVLYQGLLREGRGLETLIEAMEAVPAAALVMIGDGPQRDALREMADRALGARAHFLPFTPPDELLALTASADVGVCPQEPLTESLRLSLPNKLFEYLNAGLPVVATDLPEFQRVVAGYDVGLVVPARDPVALAVALRQALSDRDARARWRAHIPRVFEAFDPEKDRERFLDAYRRLVG